MIPALRRPPARVLTVFGPEGSGTKLLADLLATASGIFEQTSADRFEKYAIWRNTEVEVQHVSLPFGYACELGPARPAVWPVFNSSLASSTPQWGELMPLRGFINISHHVRALRAEGIHATAVVIMRDQGIAQRSNAVRHHCRNESIARAERQLVTRIISEALSGSEHGHVELVSYESLMALGYPYVAYLAQRLGLSAAFARSGMSLYGATAEHPLGTLRNQNEPYLRPLGEMVAKSDERERLEKQRLEGRKQLIESRGYEYE